ncbi:MAG: BON domain-containing protein [Bryobacterales bacterium]|nr:BON domain-containing protein [Bryobacterales bacterium]
MPTGMHKGQTKAALKVRHAVEQELASQPGLDAASIRVSAADGIITLTGHVANHAGKAAAEHAAARVPGVHAVVTELEVRLPESRRLADEEIAHAAVEAISWNSVIPTGRIDLRVENGWLTLEGDVDWEFQKSAAFETVSSLKGVRGASNLIRIKPSSVSKSVKEHIKAALAQRFGKRADHITVETSDDHVTLRGTVASLAEREAVERAAWTTPGVCHVNNNLSLQAGMRPDD